jgi:hypothetical protein
VEYNPDIDVNVTQRCAAIVTVLQVLVGVPTRGELLSVHPAAVGGVWMRVPHAVT